jgi:hypothetical protein
MAFDNAVQSLSHQVGEAAGNAIHCEGTDKLAQTDH